MAGVPQGSKIPRPALFRSGHERALEVDFDASFADLGLASVGNDEAARSLGRTKRDSAERRRDAAAQRSTLCRRIRRGAFVGVHRR